MLLVVERDTPVLDGFQFLEEHRPVSGGVLRARRETPLLDDVDDSLSRELGEDRLSGSGLVEVEPLADGGVLPDGVLPEVGVHVDTPSVFFDDEDGPTLRFPCELAGGRVGDPVGISPVANVVSQSEEMEAEMVDVPGLDDVIRIDESREVGVNSGDVKLRTRWSVIRVSMFESNRLTGSTEWIDLGFVERERTPHEIIETGIQLHLA